MEIGQKRTREENYQEYLQLKANPDYLDVSFDEQSGGVSAVHKEHCFDKQMGIGGLRRGEYEMAVVRVLRADGNRIILLSENGERGSFNRFCDGLLNDLIVEIKSVEGNGQWLIKTKLRDAAKQGAECVVIFFPVASLYTHLRITEGCRLFSSDPDSVHLQNIIKKVVVIVENRVVEMLKPPG